MYKIKTEITIRQHVLASSEQEHTDENQEMPFSIIQHKNRSN